MSTKKIKSLHSSLIFHEQYYVPGTKRRYLDLYCPNLNLAIEIDEHGHSGYCPADELERQDQINKTLNNPYRYNSLHPRLKIVSCRLSNQSEY